jgi:glycosyltransferase involved in cell wall biosynthesis
MVVTVHDLFAEVEPGWLPVAVRFQLRRTIRRACRIARRVIAVSHATRRDLTRYYGVRPEQIAVVYNGVDSAYRPAADEECQRALRERYVSGARFILYVGSRFPWRNVPRLVEAFHRLRTENKLTRHRLLLVGRDIWGNDATPALVERLGLNDAVRVAGYVMAEELPVLYRAADVLAYPSFYEGFGMPPLEAMASGTPVVTTARGGLAEVVGDAAVLVDPDSVDSIADGLERAISDEMLREQLRVSGLAQAARFSWSTAAEQTWDVYNAALQQ